MRGGVFQPISLRYSFPDAPGVGELLTDVGFKAYAKGFRSVRTRRLILLSLIKCTKEPIIKKPRSTNLHE
jgi:hypothetical protein